MPAGWYASSSQSSLRVAPEKTRFWLLENRFIEAHEDFASGFRADVRWQVLSQVAVKLSYELAKDSTVFTRSVGLFHGGRVQLEGGL